MADTRRLKQRNGVWYYRRRVPKHLVKAYGKIVVQESLGTTSLKKAKLKREAADVKWTTCFAALERGATADPPVGQSGQLSSSELGRLVAAYVARRDERARTAAVLDPPDSNRQRDEIIENIERDISILSDCDDPTGDEWVSSGVRSVLREAGAADSVTGPKYSELAALVRRGFLELERRRLARNRDDYSHRFFDHLFDPAAPPDITFGQLADERLGQIAEESNANAVSQKWIDKKVASAALIREIVGDVTSVKAVTYDVCMGLRSTLARVPANRNKLYPGLTLNEAIERAEVDGRRTMSPQTQEVYLAVLSDVLDLALKKGLISTNPAQGIRPLKRDAVAAADKREPFTPEQIVKFFRSDFYERCAASGPVPYRYDKHGWRFWLPLIFLMSGMRPREICQLECADIRQTDAGTWFFNVAASEEDEEGVRKTLKTTNSRRRVPIHPELLKIGLLAYRDDRRKANASRLFNTTPDKYGNPATYPLKRFKEQFFPAAITLQPLQTFYSFRHNFRDALRRINAPPDALLLGGWSRGKLVSDAYGDRSNPDVLAEFINGVAYPGLDLSHLYVKD